jgi:hypothetical protein
VTSDGKTLKKFYSVALFVTIASQKELDTVNSACFTRFIFSPRCTIRKSKKRVFIKIIIIITPYLQDLVACPTNHKPQVQLELTRSIHV